MELYRVCPKLKTENKFSCCQKSEYRFLGHQIDEKKTAHMIKHMIHSSTLTFLSFSAFFLKAKYLPQNEICTYTIDTIEDLRTGSAKAKCTK